MKIRWPGSSRNPYSLIAWTQIYDMERSFRTYGYHGIHTGGHKCGNNARQHAGEETDANGQHDDIKRNEDLEMQRGADDQGKQENQQQPDGAADDTEKGRLE